MDKLLSTVVGLLFIVIVLGVFWELVKYVLKPILWLLGMLVSIPALWISNFANYKKSHSIGDNNCEVHSSNDTLLKENQKFDKNVVSFTEYKSKK